MDEALFTRFKKCAVDVLGVTERTVQRDWARARAWLHKEIYPAAGSA